MPNFWMGILLLLVFGLGLRGCRCPGTSRCWRRCCMGDVVTAVRNLPQSAAHLAAARGDGRFFSLARNARLVRSSMLEALGQDFVRTARAKGLREYEVVVGHALRNAWLPVVTIVGLEFGFLLGGVVVVETIFAWPGVGRLIFNAINQRDIPLVQAAVIVLAMVFVLLNFLVDLIYARLDPRVRLSDARNLRSWARKWPVLAIAVLLASPPRPPWRPNSPRATRTGRASSPGCSRR